MDEFRIEIWDLLYRAEESKSIAEIAQIIDRDDDVVRAAIDHHWFDVAEEMVTIAYGTARLP